MQQILIISPDPESRRTFELALELAGLSTATAIDPGHVPSGSYGALLFEMVEDSDEQWRAAAEAVSMKRLTKSSAVILPRGRSDRETPEELRKASLVIKRPFELMKVVERIRDLAAGSPAPEKKAKPRVTRRKVAKKTSAKRKAPPAKRGKAKSAGRKR